MQAVILAGGKGSRLKPFTVTIPKPLMPIGDLPILEIVLRQLKYYGFTDIVLAVNHLAELIRAFFGDGGKLGVHITYVVEEQQLGTAGPLAGIDNLEENFLVMNGDLLTTLNFRELFDSHCRNRNDVTLTKYHKEITIDLGVIETSGDEFTNYIEKPTYHFDVSTGIYIFNRAMVGSIRKDARMDMPDLIMNLHKSGKKIRCYSGTYYWLDIGRIDDYDKAVQMFSERQSEFLPQ